VKTTTATAPPKINHLQPPPHPPAQPSTTTPVERSDVEVSGSGYNRKWYVRVKEMYEVIVEEYIQFCKECIVVKQ
jgi:hypothetical protein